LPPAGLRATPRFELRATAQVCGVGFVAEASEGGRAVLQRLLAIIRKELITMLRDPRARYSLILPPLIQLFIFSSAATMEVKNIHLGVVDLDRGPYAANVLEGLRGSRSFTALPQYPSLAVAGNALEREQVVGVLVLQSGFSADLAAGRSTSVQLLLDGRRSNAAQITAQYVSTIVSTAVAGGGGAPQPGAAVAGPSLPNAELVITNWFNPNLDYRWYMLPNIVGMLSLGVALMITALSVARERELGTFDQTLVSPATPVEIALGKLLPPLLVAAVQATLYLLIVTLLYGVPFRGNLLVLYAAVLTFALACAGVGLFISSMVHTQQQAFLGAFAVLLPFALLSGFATPVENMPWWLQFVTNINPLAHMLRLMQGLFLKGASLRSLAQDMVRLLEIALVTTSAAVLLFSRRAA
jgi:ABC-2 type transport system permease protein